MNEDPIKPQPSPGGASMEQLADLVYRASLAEGHKELRRANPMVTIPTTILTYGAAIGLAFLLASHTEAGKKALKTVGVSLEEEESKEEPPPPPPPPPAPAPAAVANAPKAETQREAPPPPPIDPRSEVVPEVAPRQLPRENLSMAYAGQGSGSGTGVPGQGVAGAVAGPSTGPAVAGAAAGKVVDFDYNQITVKYQPPMPPYPPLARIARIQGNVVVEIIIGTDGIPTKATALDGPPQLRPAAESYAMTWKFQPAMLNGVPVQGRFKLTLKYTLR